MSCKNCGIQVEGKYCTHCSQKADTGRLNVGHVANELWHNFTHADRSVLGLITALFTKPGLVINEYIEGKRKKYFNPYTFFLLSSAILIFITKKVFQYEDKLYHYNNEFGQFTGEHYTLIILLSLPFIAAFLRLTFIKTDLNYAEWLTFLIFAYCLINSVQIVLQLLYLPFIKHHSSVKSYTDLSTYFILFFVLVKFIHPRNIFDWIKCILSIIFIFFFIEFFANYVALWLGASVPPEVLINNYHVF